MNTAQRKLHRAVWLALAPALLALLLFAGPGRAPYSAGDGESTTVTAPPTSPSAAGLGRLP